VAGVRGGGGVHGRGGPGVKGAGSMTEWPLRGGIKSRDPTPWGGEDF
jgi:hypothetical protein